MIIKWIICENQTPNNSNEHIEWGGEGNSYRIIV